MKKLFTPLALALGIGFSDCAIAASITFESKEKMNVISISGEIVHGDYQKFNQAVDKISNDKPVLVLLDGPGGLLTEAIPIGLQVSKMKFTTVAFQGVCASSCALIWLAGDRVIIDLDRNAQVGFHSPYTIDKFGNKKNDNTASALLGGYLREIGASYRIIRYVTSVDGDSIRWLEESTAKDIGIQVEFYKVNASHSNKKIQIETKKQQDDTDTTDSQPRTFTWNEGDSQLTIPVNSNGQPHGLGTLRIFSKKEVYHINYVNGIRHGEIRKFHADGVVEVWSYVNGNGIGQPWKRFKDGKLIAQGVVNKP